MRLIVNIKLLKTKTSKKKKKVHFNSCHPDFTIDALQRMIERYPNMLPDDYLMGLNRSTLPFHCIHTVAST